MRGIIQSGGKLTPRQSSYAKEGGWLGFAHWVRDKILTPLFPVPPDPPDSLSGDEIRLPYNITTAGDPNTRPPPLIQRRAFGIFLPRSSQKTHSLLGQSVT